jgi:hypothetical protein
VRLTVIVLALWLLFVWLSRERLGHEWFTAYAMLGTSLATMLLAIATYYMARQTSRSAKATEELAVQNRRLVEANQQMVELTKEALEKPVMKEIIVKAIEPVEKLLEEDAAAIEPGEGIYLYGISKAFIVKGTLTMPRTLDDIKPAPLRNIFARHPHYWELIRRYPDFENYLTDYASSASKAKHLIEQILDQIETSLAAVSLAQVATAFPSNSSMPLKYLPFWELLAAVGMPVPHPGYDRYHLLSSDVTSFWQNHKEEIMAVVHANEGLVTATVELNKTLQDCEVALEAKLERLKQVKDELTDKYKFTDEELEEATRIQPYVARMI